MFDLLLPPGVKGLKVVLEIFKEQSLEIRSIPRAVFLQNIFWKFLEKHLWQSPYLAHLQTFKLVNILNTDFLKWALHLTVSKFNKCQTFIRGNILWKFFLEFLEYFQNSYVKEQSSCHAVGTVKETDGLLKDLRRSAWGLVIK